MGRERLRLAAIKDLEIARQLPPFIARNSLWNQRDITDAVERPADGGDGGAASTASTVVRPSSKP